MNWMVPLRRLDEAQQNVLRQCSNKSDTPKWIEGFAGSGKTVLIIHSVQNFLIQNPESKVCIVVFTRALVNLIQTGISPEFHGKIPVMTYLHAVNNDKEQYDLMAIDEVQDVPPKILKMLLNKTQYLLIGGDDAQSIYETGSRAEQIEKILNPDRLKLPMVYRLTRKIINVVKSILPDNTMVTATSGRMEEIQVTLAQAKNKEEELDWTLKQAKRFTESGHPSVIVFPNHNNVCDFLKFAAINEGIPEPVFKNNQYDKINYSLINKYFKEKLDSVCIQYIGNGYGSLEDSDSSPIVYVMTYHNIKGLDFRTVFLPLLNSDTTFWRNPDIDRRLFFVGCTRSRRDLFLSYHSQSPHPYVQQMPQQELLKIDISNNQSAPSDDFYF